MNRSSFILFVLISFLLTACKEEQKATLAVEEGVPAPLSYTEGFGVTHPPEYTTVTVCNPRGPGKTYDIYYLVKTEDQLVLTNGHKVVTPLKNTMTNSATHLGFLGFLGELHKVTGVCNSVHIYNPTILQGAKEGKIKDLGDASNLDIENLLLLYLRAVMTSAYNTEDENSRRAKQTGLPILYNIEWQEKSILGRAEWTKFVGALLDKEALADSIFGQIAKQHNEVEKSAEKSSYAPSILSGQDYRGTWSMPGGRNCSAQLFRNAGANYYYANDTTASGSISSSIEEVLIHFNQADIWVGVQTNTLEELGRVDLKYKLFKSYKDGNVYHINERTNATDGSDYWESGVARPGLLLSDVIKTVHPTLLPDYELTYMGKLKSEWETTGCFYY